MRRREHMSNQPAVRRAAAALGTVAVITLGVTGPATARPDGGGPSPTQEQYECHYLNKCTGVAAGTGQVQDTDDIAIEYLQLGGGVLAGIALAGAGMAVASRRSHSHLAHPA
jgi:hypothetical protein